MDPATAPAGAPLPSQAVLNLTLGAFLLGAVASAILFGIFCQQCFTFLKMFSDESKTLKYSVWVLWSFGMANLALGLYTIYTVLVTEVGTLSVKIPNTLAGSVIITVVSDLIVRSWFMYRIWILSERRWALLVLPTAWNVAALGVGLALSIRLMELDTTPYPASLNQLLVTDIAFIIATDFYVAATICYFLRRHGSCVSLRTRSIVNTLMVYAINTGLVTSLGWLICLITHIVLPNSLIMNGIYLSLSNLYSICLLASLNARDWFRETARQPVTLQLTSFQARPNATDSFQRSTAEQSNSSRTIEVLRDFRKNVNPEEGLRYGKDSSELSRTAC